MKGCLILIVLICFCTNARTSSPREKQIFAKIVSEIEKKFERILPFFINSRFSEIKTPSLEFPVIPSNLPDPLAIPSVAYSFRPDSNNNAVLVGDVSLCNSSIHGLSSVADKMELSLTIPNVKYGLNTSMLTFEGFLDQSLNIYNGDYVTNGTGAFKIEVINLLAGFQFGIVMDIPKNKINIEKLLLDLQFEWVSLHTDGLLVNGKPHNWDDLNNLLKPTFDDMWKVTKVTTEKNTQDIVNEILYGCRLSDLIFQDYDCIIAGELMGIKKHLKLTVTKLFEKVNNGVCPAVPLDPTTTTAPPTSNPTSPTSKTTTPGNKATLTEVNNLIYIIYLAFVIFMITRN